MSTETDLFAEERLEKGYNLSILGRLTPFVRPQGRLVLLSILLVSLFTLCELAIPYFSKVAIDDYIVPGYQEAGSSETGRVLEIQLDSPEVREVVAAHKELFSLNKDQARIPLADLQTLDKQEINVLRQRDLQGIGRVAGFFILLTLFSYGVHFAQQVIMELTGQRIMHGLRMAVYDKIQRLSFGFFNRHPVGRLVTRASNDVQNMYEFFTNVISFVFKDVFMLLGIALILFSLNWQLTLVSFSLIPLTAVASTLFARRARDIFRILRIKAAEINTRFAESIEGLSVIQLFLKEVQSRGKMEKLNRENYAAGLEQIRILGVFLPLVEFFGFLATGIIVLYGGSKVMGQTLSLGTLVAFLSYIRMFFRPLRDLAEKFNILQNALTSAERIFQILDNKRDIDPGSQAGTVPSSREIIQRIEFKDVSFAYTPEEPILENISLQIEPGENLALVGPTGSGKSTLISLLAGFYRPDSGQILINGRDQRDWDIAALRAGMALILQDQFLFSGTVRENILQGNPGLSEDRLQQILEDSNANAVVQRLPQGLETQLKQGGASISSGQRQLISIARAFARDANLLILDEATSSIDSKTEEDIQQAVKRLMQGRTCISIAHRPSAARNASRIIVLHQGRIIESGSHSELVRQQGFYARLRSLQA